MVDNFQEDDILIRFEDGIKKFNKHEFFECHDVLEDVWYEIRGYSRKFYQGLIHLAVGFYHIKERENLKGALSQLSKGFTKLKNYEPEFQGVELKNLLKNIEKCVEEIELVKKSKEYYFDEKLIPKINFNSNKFKRTS